MRFFRNPEIIKTLMLHGILSVAACSVAFLWEFRFGLFVLVLCAIFFGVFLFTTYRRYRKIFELSAELDRVLHGEEQISFAAYAEGELGVLQSEIQKMTIRLREQRQRLQNEKVYLADSIADISHQIRTPLTSVHLLAQFLSEPKLSEERRIQLVHEMYELLSRIDWQITTLLKISKLDAKTVQFQKETLLLEELVRRATAPLLVPLELREQQLTVVAEGNICVDCAWTGEALGNIVKNCMEHTPRGGEIKISATENALYSEILVADNGSGIEKEDLPYIFERFYKGKNSDDRSFGIGLALARMVITGQDGTVKAENNAESGAIFTVRFYKGSLQ